MSYIVVYLNLRYSVKEGTLQRWWVSSRKLSVSDPPSTLPLDEKALRKVGYVGYYSGQMTMVSVQGWYGTEVISRKSMKRKGKLGFL